MTAERVACHLCPVEIPGWWALFDHMRLFHPDADAVPEVWPDGRVVVEDLSCAPSW